MEGRGEASLIYLLGSLIAGDLSFAVFLSLNLRPSSSCIKTIDRLTHSSDVGSVSSPCHLRRARTSFVLGFLLALPCDPILAYHSSVCPRKLMGSGCRDCVLPSTWGNLFLIEGGFIRCREKRPFHRSMAPSMRQSDHSSALSSLPPFPLSQPMEGSYLRSDEGERKACTRQARVSRICLSLQTKEVRSSCFKEGSGERCVGGNQFLYASERS